MSLNGSRGLLQVGQFPSPRNIRSSVATPYNKRGLSITFTRTSSAAIAPAQLADERHVPGGDRGAIERSTHHNPVLPWTMKPFH